jgi:hypothetical protein
MTTNWFLMYVYRLITWYGKLRKQRLSVKISMERDIMWPTLHLILCHGGLHEVGRLETTLAEDEITYHESVGMLVCPQPSQAHPRVSQVHPRAGMSLVLLTPAWTLQTRPRFGWVGMMLQTHTRVLQTFLQVGEIIRYNYMLLYIMKIMNKNIVSLIFNKILCYINYPSKFYM